MLYTPIAMEDIYPSDTQVVDTLEYHLNGRVLILRRDPQGRARIERLLSTDPQDFLDPQYQPQSIVFM